MMKEDRIRNRTKRWEDDENTCNDSDNNHHIDNAANDDRYNNNNENKIEIMLVRALVIRKWT